MNNLSSGNFTRMGSKVMPLANFHRNWWREDKTHAFYVFSILLPFDRCINCTSRHNISRKIYFCTNPTQMWLSKMVGRSVENEIEIRADIKTKSASSPKIVIKKIYSKIRRKDILLSRLQTWLAFQKHLHCAFGEIF